MLGPLYNLLYKTWTHCTYCLYVRLLTLSLLRAAWPSLTAHVSICHLTKAKTMDTQQPHPLAIVTLMVSLNTEKEAAIIPRRRMTESYLKSDLKVGSVFNRLIQIMASLGCSETNLEDCPFSSQIF